MVADDDFIADEDILTERNALADFCAAANMDPMPDAAAFADSCAVVNDGGGVDGDVGHLILAQPCKQAYLLEAPNDRRIFFVLPWQGNTLVGTTEGRQRLNEPIACSPEEQNYLLDAWVHYFPGLQPNVIGTFAGLRPLLRSAQDPNKATREYAIHRTGKLVTVLSGKWTTAMALADKVSHAIH